MSWSDPLPLPLTPEQIASFGENRGPAVIGITSTMMGLSTLAVGLRFFARYSRRMPFCIDDWLALGSLLFLILYCVTCILSAPYGIGRHSWAADPTEIWKILQIALFNGLIYFTDHWLIKMSILCLYKRIFTFRIAWFKYAVCTVGAYTTAWFISSFFAGLFQCFPPAFFWEQYKPVLMDQVPTGSCGAGSAPLVISTSALNSAGDIMVFSLPIAMLSQLRLSRAKKISLFAMFATGALAIAAGIVRLTRTVEATQPGTDTTWVLADIYIWTTIEAGVALICACLPIIGPVFDFSKRKSTQGNHGWMSQKGQPDTNNVGGNPSKWDHADSGAQHSIGNYDTASLEELELRPQSTQHIVRTDRYTVESSPRTNQCEHQHWFDAYIAQGMRIQPERQV